MERLAIDVLSGVTAGILTNLVGYPFDTLKTRLAMGGGTYTSMTDCIKKTLKADGVRGFYTGFTAPLAGQLAFRTSLFLVNGAYLRAASAEGTRPLSYLQYALGGVITWSAASLIECPIQMAAVQMQALRVKEATIPGFVAEYKSVGQFVFKAPSKYGLRALYTGFVPITLRNALGGGFHFGLFEMIRRETAAARGETINELPLPLTMAAASVGGIFFWLVPYPLDLVRSVIQADHLDPAKRKYKGMGDAFVQLWKEGGAKRFTAGLAPCLLRAVPANAVLLTSGFRLREVGYQWLDARKAAVATTAAAGGSQ